MTSYVNPHGMDKEDFLLRHGQRVQEQEAVIEEERYPVCLVDNGMFSAAGIAYDQGQLDRMKINDGRYKQWYMCRKTDLRKVSDVVNYER